MKTPNTIPVSFGRLTLRVAPCQIIHLEGDNHYARAYMVGGRVGLLTMNLSRASELLPDFWRLHKSHMVNPQYVAGRTVAGRLRLQSGAALPIARRRAKTVRGLLNQHFN